MLAGTDPAALVALLATQSDEAAACAIAVCDRLATVADTGAEPQLQAVSAGALEAVCVCMATYPADERVQTSGCRALATLTSNLSETHARAGVAGACELLVSALLRFPHAPGCLQHEATRALDEVTHLPANAIARLCGRGACCAIDHEYGGGAGGKCTSQ